MINDLTKQFMEKTKKESTNLRKLSEVLGIKYDRMYKWSQGLSNPKPPDDRKLEDWINGRLSNIVQNRSEFVEFDLGASIKKTEIMVEVILSAVAELVAEKRNNPSSLVREQFQAVVNSRLRNEEPKQSKEPE